MRKYIKISLILTVLLLLSGCSRSWEAKGPVQSDVLQETPGAVSYPIAEAGAPLKIVLPEAAKDCEALRQAEERTGIPAEYEFLPMAEYEMEIRMRIAGGVPMDLYYAYEASSLWAYDLIDKGAMALDPYLPTYAPDYLAALQADVALGQAVCTGDEGQVTGFYQLAEGEGFHTSGLWIRGDWLEQVGLEVPTNLDEYETVLTAFRDEIGCEQPLLLWHTGAFRGDAIASAFDVTAFFTGESHGSLDYDMGLYVEDGQVKFGPAEEGFFDYLALMHDWYELDFFTSDYVAWLEDRDYNEHIVENRGGIVWSAASSGFAMSQNIHGGGTLIPLPAMTEHLGTQATGSTTGVVWGVAAFCEQPELAVQWCNYWYTEEGMQLMNAPVAPELLTAEDRSQLLPGRWDQDIMRQLTAAQVREPLEVWGVNCDSSWRIPGDLRMSPEDREYFIAAMQDLSRAVTTFTNQVILGEKTLEDKADYLKELEACGLRSVLQCIDKYLVTG